MEYAEVEDLIRESANADTELHSSLLGSKTTPHKRQLFLYGKKKVALGKKKPEQVYIGGVIEQKDYVGFYFFPIYTDPGSFDDLSPLLRTLLTGKSCFHIRELTNDIKVELRKLLARGFSLYKKKGWV